MSDDLTYPYPLWAAQLALAEKTNNETMYKTALHNATVNHGDRSLVTCRVLSALSLFYRNSGQPHKASQYQRKANDIFEKFGRDDIDET